MVLRNLSHITCRGEKKAELGEDTDILTPLSHRTGDLLIVGISVIVIAAQTLLNIWCQNALGNREIWYAQAVTVS